MVNDDAGGPAMSGAQGGKSTPVVAVDTGGTFTDLILLYEGSVTALKVPSTPADPAVAVLEGLNKLLAPLPSPRYVLVHGSTVATNAILERKGSRVGLITNAGFEDVIEIGRQNRPQLYALTGTRPPPLVSRDDRIGIEGRTDADGTEHRPTEPEELASLPQRLRGVEAVAVVLLHSYLDPSGEEEVARALAELDTPISVSSRILPEFREFERTSTTVANAYVAPRMAGYLERIRKGAKADRIRIMGSNGGSLPIERAADEPVHTVLSGPAGGVVAALEWGRRGCTDRVLSFDMGGTSTDVSLVPGTLLQTREGEVGGVPIAIPLLDIHTVGAGGGSIARVDPGGALRVGPESAGADPGPISYGRGGNDVTVTDAHVWLGRLPPDGFLGGELGLSRERIGGPMQALATAAGTSPDAVAEGVLEVVNTTMESALRVISVERGVDPSGYDLVAFGGAGGLHAAELVERLGLKSALIPPDPGLLSAHGMLLAPIVRERSLTVLASTDDHEALHLVTAGLGELEEEARAEMMSEGFSPDRLDATRWVDARYEGQSYELRVPARDWIEAFHVAHRERYGYEARSSPVEAVTLRVRLETPGEPVPLSPQESSPSDPTTRSTPVVVGGRTTDAQLITRSAVTARGGIEGPAVVLEYSSTIWCPPGWRLDSGNGGILRLRQGA